MPYRFLGEIVLLSSFIVLAGCSSIQESYSATGYQLRFADDPSLAAVEQDSTLWQNPFPHAAPDSLGIWWLRSEVEISPGSVKENSLGLAVLILGSFEMYWDGKLIGRNGVVGLDRATEIPGTYRSFFPIPDSMQSSGSHSVALRISNAHAGSFVRFHGIYLGDYQSLIRSGFMDTALIHILAGFFLVVAIYYGLIYILNRRQSYVLLFAVLSLCFFFLILFEYLKYYYIYPYPFHLTRLRIIAGFTFVIACLLPMFYLFRFRFKWRWLPAIVYVGLLVYTWLDMRGYDAKCLGMISWATFTSLAIVLYALYQRQKGALLGLLSVVAWGQSIFFYYDYMIFSGFAAMIVLNLFALAIEMREQRRQHEASLVRSSRLEIELLKKNIQPHFLMNSLTSLIDWIEEKPAVGVQFIEALAREFEILMDISDATLIPIEQEISLCESHLKTMSFRKERHFTLKTTGICAEAMIPPALFLTCVENAMTHNVFTEKRNVFEIRGEQHADHIKYTVLTGGKTAKQTTPSPYGTGLKYIRARLEESFPQRWRLTSSPGAAGWQTEIHIFNSQSKN